MLIFPVNPRQSPSFPVNSNLRSNLTAKSYSQVLPPSLTAQSYRPVLPPTLTAILSGVSARLRSRRMRLCRMERRSSRAISI